MTILCMETSNKTLSVALGIKDKPLATYTSQKGINHSLTLMPAIDFLVAENNLTPQDLTGVVVAKGPGSYTGLRIGMTTAKTLSWTLNIPMYAVSTLALIASNGDKTADLIIPLIDARRQSVFTGVYKWEEDQLVSVMSDKYISLEDWLEELGEIEQTICFVSEDISNLLQQLEPFINDKQATIIIKPVEASHLLDFVSETTRVYDVEAITPTYLKRVEAEEKWLEQQKGDSINTNDYVTRVE